MEDSVIKELIDNFAQAARQHNIFSISDWRKANKEAKKMHSYFLEITSHGQPARVALLELTESEETSVSLMAAVYSLKFNSEKSLMVLKKLEKQPDVIGFQAQQAIKRWEEGSWQLE
jgi:hypothetical protein